MAPIHDGNGSATPSDLGDGTLGDAMRWGTAVDEWTLWLQAGDKAKGTVYLRRRQVRSLAKGTRRGNPWRVSTDDIVGWMAHQAWSPETYRSYRSTVQQFYAWAYKTRRSRHNPAMDLPAIPQPGGVPRPTPDVVFDCALAQASDRDRLILLLGAYAGLRRAEIAGLRWDQIEMSPGFPPSPPGLEPVPPGRAVPSAKKASSTMTQLRIKGKGGKTRTVPVHPKLASELIAERVRRARGDMGLGHRYRTGVDGPWLFPGRDGRPLAPNRVGQIARELLGPGWTTHTLRHRFATRVYNGTHDLFALQRLLGHKNPATTAGYTQLDGETLTNAVNAI